MKNAFAFPPDKIIFTSALLKKLNDDEFIAILAHEIGHLHFKHYKPSVFRAIVLDFFGIGLSSQFLKYFGSLMSVKHSRDAERESDEYAADLMIKNGIDLSNNISAMNKITEDSTELKYLSFMSTHPATSERIEYFKSRKQLSPPKRNDSSDLVKALLSTCLNMVKKN
jgi:Zn-dependent protease with chaperone function